MKVHLIKLQTIEKYVGRHASSRSSFELWIVTVKGATWNIPEDILNTFGTADLLGNGSQRVVFNIGGNHHRMICQYAFGASQVHLFVCWIGTHAAYTELCANRKQYIISDY
ncbi:MAG TPA: type II toxin-antitoxin system HigB family toxin [Chitinophaga sp.]|uniref:type II toxin-antitoxin system HigB family toxin n=1 Tax=Chitinophaga sp. TaxID=1869181 RepID=UPI002F92B213